MPHSPRAFQRLHSLGRRRPQPLFRPRRPLQTTDLGLPHRLLRSNPHLAHRPPQRRQQRVAKSQPPRPLRQPKLDTARHRPQFLRLGTRLLPFQFAPTPARSGVVGEIHDDAVGGAGFGASVRGFGGVLLLFVSGLGLAGQFAVVGYEGVQGGLRLEGVSL